MIRRNRLLQERVLDPNDREAPTALRAKGRPARSVTVNIAESPLGWLFARGHVSQRQFDAGERLRFDFERGLLSQQVTMAWDAAPVARGRGGSPTGIDLSGSQIDAKARFMGAIEQAGPGLAIFCGGSFAPGKACALSKPHWVAGAGGQARANPRA